MVSTVPITLLDLNDTHNASPLGFLTQTVLFSIGGAVKLADFGLSKIMNASVRHTQSLVGVSPLFLYCDCNSVNNPRLEGILLQ
jgi:hypothetical protein